MSPPLLGFRFHLRVKYCPYACEARQSLGAILLICHYGSANYVSENMSVFSEFRISGNEIDKNCRTGNPKSPEQETTISRTGGHNFLALGRQIHRLLCVELRSAVMKKCMKICSVALCVRGSSLGVRDSGGRPRFLGSPASSGCVVSRRLLCILVPPLLGCFAVWVCVFLVHCVLEFMSPWNLMSPWGDGSGKSDRTQTTPTKRPGDHGGPTVPAWSPGA